MALQSSWRRVPPLVKMVIIAIMASAGHVDCLTLHPCAPCLKAGENPTLRQYRRCLPSPLAGYEKALRDGKFSPSCDSRWEGRRSGRKDNLNRRHFVGQIWKVALVGATTGIARGRPAHGAEDHDLSRTDKEITLADFNQLLLDGQIVKCDFYGADFGRAVVQLADGTRALIGEGYPQEQAMSDTSPMKIVSQLRNAGVPYSSPFSLGGYEKAKVYKTTATREAEERQRQEDETLDRLMGNPRT